MFDFKGKTALITGAASGIGRATVEFFMQCGAQVLMADINAAPLQAEGSSLEAYTERLSACQYDARDPSSADTCVSQAITRFGRLDFLVAMTCPFDDRFRPRLPNVRILWTGPPRVHRHRPRMTAPPACPKRGEQALQARL